MKRSYIESLFNNELVGLLDTPKTYLQIGLHAYSYKQLIPKFAKKLFRHIQKDTDLDPMIEKELMKNTYLPKAKKFIVKKFKQRHNKLLNEDFYQYLNNEATYSEIKYLRYFLDKNKLPKLHKQKAMSKQDKLEFEFIRNTSTFTRYKNSKKQKRERGYGQFCEWCKKELKFPNSRMVKALNDHIFVCSKKCADAARNNLKRNGYLKPRRS